ncbi:hypothetical protein niasHT_029275 [Heterodera trifolii]|uniref:Gustatory receptor n=1 Tax=Heterodera trifolii TaxID=157864 RepID=A0ABD2KED8_9BILA
MANKLKDSMKIIRIISCGSNTKTLAIPQCSSSRHRCSMRLSSLRGTSSFLLALTAFFETVHQFGHLFFLCVSLSGRNFVSYFTAFKFLVVPLVSCSASLALIALTGMDRLIQLAFEKWHAKVNRTVYLGTFVLISLFFGILMGLKYAQIAFCHPQWPQTGTVSDIFLFEFKPFFFSFMLIVNFIAIVFYLFIWVTNTNARLFKSLVVTISISIGCYLFNGVVRLFVLPPLHLDQVKVWFVEMFFGILLNVGVALNAPVLFICSMDYRKCFVLEFALLKSKLEKVAKTFPKGVHLVSALAFRRQHVFPL